MICASANPLRHCCYKHNSLNTFRSWQILYTAIPVTLPGISLRHSRQRAILRTSSVRCATPTLSKGCRCGVLSTRELYPLDAACLGDVSSVLCDIAATVPWSCLLYVVSVNTPDIFGVAGFSWRCAYKYRLRCAATSSATQRSVCDQSHS